MQFRTIVDIPAPGFAIEPFEEMLFVGSCFADSMGKRFADNKFRVTVNPYGVMYNPASVLHTVSRYLTDCPDAKPRSVFITLGTNHIYRLKATGEIVDNCQKRPQKLFDEEQLTVDGCADCLSQAVSLLRQRNPDVHIVVTVSPIRYRKYGYHESQLSKAVLLLAAHRLVSSDTSLYYFPAYEIVVDELRDYRFYAADMLHPSEQAADYIYERLAERCLSAVAKAFVEEWQPVRDALNHRPFRPDSDEYRAFMDKTMLKVAELQRKYPNFAQSE